MLPLTWRRIRQRRHFVILSQVSELHALRTAKASHKSGLTVRTAWSAWPPPARVAEDSGLDLPFEAYALGRHPDKSMGGMVESPRSQLIVLSTPTPYQCGSTSSINRPRPSSIMSMA
jgi:hypothetical protein